MISPLLFLWKKRLSSLCIAIWLLPLLAIATAIVTDEEAAKKNIDSIYIGTIVATINSTSESTSKSTSCIPSVMEFGPYSSSRLTFGPSHNGYLEPNPFFLALVGGESGKFLSSVQSSLTSKQNNKTWWTVQGWQDGGPGKGAFQIYGTMIFDVGDDDHIGEERNQLSGVWEAKKGDKKSRVRRDDKFFQPFDGDTGEMKDLCAKRRQQVLRWRHKRDTTILKGHVGTEEANMSVTGQVVITLSSTDPQDEEGNEEEEDEEDDFEEAEEEEEEEEGPGSGKKRNRLERRQKSQEETQDMTYTIIFSGKHYSGSAPLPTQGLVWREAGSGPSMEPYKFFTVEVQSKSSTTSSSATKSTSTKPTSTKPTSTTKSTSTTTDTQSTISSTTPIATPLPTDDSQEEEEGPLPRGSIIGIVVGGVLACLVFAVMIYLLKGWRAKRKEPKVYPELAYIYSTPFTSTNKRTGGGGIGGNNGYIPAGSRGTSSHSRNDNADNQGTYYGPPAPQLEVDLGDRAPFLGTNTGDSNPMGSPGTGVQGLGSPHQMIGGLGVGGGSNRHHHQESEDLEKEMEQPMLHHPSATATYYDRGHGHGREF